MELSTEKLKIIEEYSEALLSPSEIAVLIDVEYNDQSLFCDMCINHRRTGVYQAYQKGKLKTKFELRKTVIKLAKAGSPAAEPLVDKYLKELSISESNV